MPNAPLFQIVALHTILLRFQFCRNVLCPSIMNTFLKKSFLNVQSNPKLVISLYLNNCGFMKGNYIHSHQNLQNTLNCLEYCSSVTCFCLIELYNFFLVLQSLSQVLEAFCFSKRGRQFQCQEKIVFLRERYQTAEEQIIPLHNSLTKYIYFVLGFL